MKLIKWSVSTGMIGSKIKGEFEVDSNTSEDDIDQMVYFEISQRIDWHWTEEEIDKCSS